MAVFNLTINYPDGEGPRILSALKANYGVATNADAIEGFRGDVVALLRTTVLGTEQRQALATVSTTNPS